MGNGQFTTHNEQRRSNGRNRRVGAAGDERMQNAQWAMGDEQWAMVNGQPQQQSSRKRERCEKEETMNAKKAGGKGKAAEMERFARRAEELGAVKAKVIRAKEIVTGEWVRWKCQFGCGGFGSSLVCPPHTPRPAETRRMIDEYERAILFEAGRREPKKIAVALEREIFLSGYYRALGLGSGPCSLCEECAFEKGCRHAEESRPSMEACGIDVYATVRRQGFEIEVVKTHKDRQHYFGVVLVE